MRKTMVKLATLLMLMCTLYNSCQAQGNQHSAQSQFGIKGGINFSVSLPGEPK